MLKRLETPHLTDRFPLGAKTLALDPQWSESPIADIEVALLRAATFPEFGRLAGLGHEFIILDPSTTPQAPGHEDLAVRMAETGSRLGMPVTTIGHASSEEFGAGGFPYTVHAMGAMGEAEFAAALATLRDRVGWVLTGSRLTQRRHVVVPLCEGVVLAVVLDLLAQLPPAARPFVHLATRWCAADMPNLLRFGGTLERFGRAIQQINAERQSVFLYGWSRRLAQRLSTQFGVPVQALDPPPEYSLAADSEAAPERFTVGYFGAPREDSGFDRLAGIVRATNRASGNPRRARFVVQLKPDRADGTHSPRVRAEIADLALIPERNVSLIEEVMPRATFFAALKQIDALLLPASTEHGSERLSHTALHAMAAGKLIFAYEGVSLSGTVRNRVLTGRDDRTLGELISDTAGDLASVRTAAKVAKATFWATLRPSRLFAQLLYGPLVVGGAEGHLAF